MKSDAKSLKRKAPAPPERVEEEVDAVSESLAKKRKVTSKKKTDGECFFVFL